MSPKLKRRLQYNFSNKQEAIVNQSSAGLTIFCYPELKSFYFANLSLDLYSFEVIFLACLLSYFFLLLQIGLDARRSVTRAARKSIFLHFILNIFIVSFSFWVVERTQGDEVVKDPSFFDPEHWEQGTTCRYKYRNKVTEIHKYNDSMWGTLILKKDKKSSVLEGQNASEC